MTGGGGPGGNRGARATRAERAWLAARAAGDPQADYDDPHPLRVARRVQSLPRPGGAPDEHALFRALAGDLSTDSGRAAHRALRDHLSAAGGLIPRTRTLNAAEERHLRVANAVFLVQKDLIASLIPPGPTGAAADEDRMLEGTVK